MAAFKVRVPGYDKLIRSNHWYVNECGIGLDTRYYNTNNSGDVWKQKNVQLFQEDLCYGSTTPVPQPLPISLVLQTLPQLRCPSLDTLQPLNVSLGVRGPTLNTAFAVWPHQCRAQGDDPFPSPAGHTIPDTSQDAVGLLGHLGTLLARIRQDPALSVVEPHTTGPSPSIQPVQVPLQSLPTLKQINTPAQLGVICKLTEGALDPLVQTIDKDIKQNWPQHRALGNTACDWPTTGVNSIHHHSLGPASQLIFYPAKCAPVQAVSKGDQVGQAGPAFHKPVLAGPDHLVVLYVLRDGTQDDLLYNLTRHQVAFYDHMVGSVDNSGAVHVVYLGFKKAFDTVSHCTLIAKLVRSGMDSKAVVESDEVSPQPPFLQAEQPQLPQPLPISLVLQTLPQLRCPSLDTFQPLNVSLVVRGPTLNTAFEGLRDFSCSGTGSVLIA
ncbi:hypothetical protein QYF61_017755 [Mycteria americana]|uniref:Uncharacterized protein n=1 Tax=Mycteria americana TaxID=33587 RepID=A0AAN7NKS0_MYCAM|nr:hypothetical protein QYF61_017755 [Mycteria americana]